MNIKSIKSATNSCYNFSFLLINVLMFLLGYDFNFESNTRRWWYLDTQNNHRLITPGILVFPR